MTGARTGSRLARSVPTGFGAQLSSYRLPWPQIEATVQTIENGRWRSLWFSDHFLPPAAPNDEHKSALEVWTLITAAAMLTERVRLGTLACGVTYRNPALLAKICASVDHISGGRMELGIGAAWFEREHHAYGWDFPGVRERCDRLEEAAQLIRLLFTKKDDEKVTFEGRHYRLHEAPLAPGSTRPRSTRKAHIPILIGGNGEKRTLRTCARYGDISNLDFWHPGGVDVFRHKQEVLDRHCEDAGRDPAEVKRTVALPFRLFANDQEARKSPGRPWYCWGTAPSIQDLLQQYIEAGAEEIILCGVPNQPESWQQIDDEILAAFD